MPSASRNTKQQNLNFWAMLNNVLIASLAKGQFLTALLFGAFVFMVWRMPSEDVSRLVFTIITDLENGKLLGYVLGLGATGRWCLHTKRQRRLYEAEMARLAEQRDALQARVLPDLLESSEGKRSRRPRK
jgi:hypothetical protein